MIHICALAYTFALWYNTAYNLSIAIMKVFFTCSTNNILKYATYYRTIRDGIISLGYKINRDWLDYSINIAQRRTSDVPSHTIYKDVITAIHTADIVVVDATVKSMSLGHQITYALQKGKPVLLLTLKRKGKKIEKLFIEGSDSKDLSSASYRNTKEIKNILKNFFKKYGDKSVRRFNLILTGTEDSYISWSSFNYKKTQTEIIQEAIDKMVEEDIVYKKYLSRQS